MSNIFLAVTYQIPSLRDKAAELARNLQLTLIDPSSVTGKYDYLLVLTSQHLELRETLSTAPGPVYVDFLAGAANYRRRFGGGRRQPLARAIGLRSGYNPKVLDATTGLGRDSFVLACLGCRVHMLERSPVVAALVQDGLMRAAQDPEVGPIVRERMDLTSVDSRLYMMNLEEFRRPDVVYLDPMYPHRAKSALVKKEMRLLRAIVGEDLDASVDLLTSALQCARRRVVVKRPRQAPPLAGPGCTLSIRSSNTRFDVYLIPSRL